MGKDMELHKLDMETIKGYDSARLREAEAEVRKEMVNIRMDIYTARNQHTAKIRGLKKSLARLLTVQGRPASRVKTPVGKGK
jgi:ribosomal protein L29